MQKIRAEKEFVVRWSDILTNGQPDSLEGRDLSLYLINPYGVESSLAITVENNTITARISAGTCNVLGQYRLKLYENKGKSGQTVLDHCEGFVVVPTTCQEGDNTPGLDIDSVELSGGDMALGVKGDKGDPLRYEDLTDEQKEELQRPALEAVEPLRTSMQTGLNLLLGSDTSLLNNISTYQISSANIAGRQADGWWRVNIPNGSTDGEIYIEDNLRLITGKIYTQSIEIRSDGPVTAQLRFHRAYYDYDNILDEIETLNSYHYRLIGSYQSDGYAIRPLNIWHINAPSSTYLEIRFPIVSETDHYIPWRPSLYDLTEMRQEQQQGVSLDDAPSDGYTYGRKDGTWNRTVGRIDPNSNGTGEVFNDYANNIASGRYAHAEGYKTTAEGGYGTHAEGNGTRAGGLSAHAEGRETIAEREASHAEGYRTKALWDHAHAEGYGTMANSIGSHTEGLYTTVYEAYSHAEGKYNAYHVGSIHMVGIGTSINDRKNAHEIMLNGDHYIYGIGGYDGKNYTEAKTLQKVIAELSTQIQTLQTTINELKGEQA